PAPNVYGASVAICRTTPERQLAAWLFLKWFTEPEQQARWVVAWAESGLTLVRLWARMLLTVVKPAHISRRAVHAAIRYPTSRLDGVRPERPVRLPRSQVVERLGADTERRCQVVVVGSGAGGAVMAAELAERGVDVVLVEEGRVHTAEELGHDPSRTIREAYREGATTLALGRPAIPIPLGKTVGGTTTINSGTCFRVPDRVLDRWEKLGLPVDRAHLDQCYSRVEERISVKEVPPELLGGSSHVVARGAEVMGLDHGPLKRNIDGCQRSGVCAFGCPRNGKQSMNITYVPRALEAGATLYTGMRATRVLKKGGRAVGVVASRPDGGPTLTLRADAVVSSCGSISGVSFLKGVGLRSKHLGRHLTIHPAAKIVGWMPEEVNGWDDTPQGYGVYNFAEQGLMFEGAFVPPEYTSIALPFVGRAFTEVMEAFQHLAVFGFMVSDEPSGRVFRAPDGRPVITYWMTRGDLEKVRIGLRILAELFFAAGAERIFLPIAGIEEQPTLDAALAALEARLDPMALELAAFHPLGTARMAAARRDGVVDPDLQSWELPGLYVVDGGVFPTSLGVNPQLTIMCYATRAAQMLAARLGAG
ncbi:MAG: GMC family oxidoreductase N-terminal domain-containing protein, partial [Myxococcota bacterium]|nr:GMC family oxidoreductase N-terminal domain-containing protein [Myxococcota bacterium]